MKLCRLLYGWTLLPIKCSQRIYHIFLYIRIRQKFCSRQFISSIRMVISSIRMVISSIRMVISSIRMVISSIRMVFVTPYVQLYILLISPLTLCMQTFKNTDMRRLTTGIRSEKCVVMRFLRCANVIECNYTKLDSVYSLLYT